VAFEGAPKWKMMPPEWKSDVECQFFYEVDRRGLGNLKDIAGAAFFAHVFGSGPVPIMLTKVQSVIKRISALYSVARSDSGAPQVKQKAQTKRKDGGEVIELGTIVTDRALFHTKRIIFPVGFKSVRMDMSLVEPGRRTKWFSEIMDGGLRPIFRVWSEELPARHFDAFTPADAWAMAWKMMSSKCHRSGLDAFLLNSPEVISRIQNLPGAELLTDYDRWEASNRIIEEENHF
jgi:hypothetical protein